MINPIRISVFPFKNSDPRKYPSNGVQIKLIIKLVFVNLKSLKLFFKSLRGTSRNSPYNIRQLIVFISLYILKLPYYLGLIIVFLGTVFYFSQHRSFTHSIFGVLTLTATVSLILIWAYELLMNITIIPTSYLFMAILIALLSFLFLNKKLLLIFLPLFFISLFLFGTLTVNYIEIAIGLFLGLLSHIILDAFSPSGIKLFAPISSKKSHKQFGMLSIIILGILAIYLRRFEILYLMAYFFPNIY